MTRAVVAAWSSAASFRPASRKARFRKVRIAVAGVVIGTLRGRAAWT